MKHILVVTALLCATALAQAQRSLQYVQFTGEGIVDMASTMLQIAAITLTPVRTPESTAPLSPHPASGSRAISMLGTYKVTGRATSAQHGTAQVADVTRAQPKSYCNASAIQDNDSADTWYRVGCHTNNLSEIGRTSLAKHGAVSPNCATGSRVGICDIKNTILSDRHSVTASTAIPNSQSRSSATDHYGVTMGNLRNATSRSVKEWGAAGDGSTDDYAAIERALSWEAANPGTCLYFPPGVYAIRTPIIWSSPSQMCLKGESHQSTAIYYTGPAGADSALSVNVCPVPGQTCSNGFGRLRIENIGIAAESTNALYAFHGTQIGAGSMYNVAFSGGSSSAFEGDFWNGQQALTNLVVDSVGLPSAIPFSCVNGLTFNDGLYNATGTTYPSNQFALVMPTVENCSGIGLNMQSADAVTITDAQIASNHQNLYDNCPTPGCNGTGNTFEQPLLESTTAVDETHQPSQFFGLLEGSQINTYYNAIFVNSQITTLDAVSGPSPTLKNSRVNGILDTSTDGIQLDHNTYINGGKTVREQKSVYNRVPGGCIETAIHVDYSFDGDENGTIVFSTVPTQLNGGTWRAFVRGTVTDGTANLSGLGEIIELTNDSPAINFSDGGTLTLSPSSSGLKWIASGVTSLWGVVHMDFYPGSGCGYHQPGYGAYFSSPLNLASGTLFRGAFVAGGVQSVTGCSLTGRVGGATAGKFTSGVTGTCTVTISPGFVAPNGYRCSATDLTTFADALEQTATTRKSCTISGTTAKGDSVTWAAIAF